MVANAVGLDLFAQFSAQDAKPTDPNERAAASADPGGYNAFWMDPGTRLAVVRGEARTSFITEPANGKIPYTAAGSEAFRAARASMSFAGPETRALGERCLMGFGSTGGPPMLPDLYNNNEYACHEGNYALPGILAGARKQEQEAAARTK